MDRSAGDFVCWMTEGIDVVGDELTYGFLEGEIICVTGVAPEVENKVGDSDVSVVAGARVVELAWIAEGAIDVSNLDGTSVGVWSDKEVGESAKLAVEGSRVDAFNVGSSLRAGSVDIDCDVGRVIDGFCVGVEVFKLGQLVGGELLKSQMPTAIQSS